MKEERRREKEKETDYLSTRDNYKRCNIHVLGIPEREEQKQENKYFKQ